MEIEILTAESLGVRGLCCYVKTRTKKILIDPGIALGYSRYNHLPHPFQVAVDERIRKRIISKWSKATDIVFSHFHGDHIPLVHANPYQLSLNCLSTLKPKVRIWLSIFENLNNLEKSRFTDLEEILGKNYNFVDSQFKKDFCFSKMVYHGERDKNGNKVFMTRIEEDGFVFVHGSDIQLLDEEAVQIILSWKPDLLVVSGPPLYLSTKMNDKLSQIATNNALLLSNRIPTVIIDHHLLRGEQGLDWLRYIDSKTKNKVLCAAEFMQQLLMMLEADRIMLYKEMPVTPDWHTKYVQGFVNTQYYWAEGIKYIKKNQKHRQINI
jgi:hypothetical protein